MKHAFHHAKFADADVATPGGSMRILTVNVNTTESMTHSIAEAARAAVGADTEIIGVTPTS